MKYGIIWNHQKKGARNLRGFKRALEQDMALEKKVIRQINRRLKILPEGWLKQGKNGASVYENRTHSLPIESQRAVEIAMRNLLEKKKQIIENNLRAQERLLKTYQSYRDDQVLEGMRQVYRNILNRFWANREKERLAKRVAEAEEQRKSGGAYHPEHLIQRNLKGEVQRSKSESILSMLYDSLQIPYNYEERVYWPQDAPERA